LEIVGADSRLSAYRRLIDLRRTFPLYRTRGVAFAAADALFWPRLQRRLAETAAILASFALRAAQSRTAEGRRTGPGREFLQDDGKRPRRRFVGVAHEPDDRDKA
jgi:hypothetical protein